MAEWYEEWFGETYLELYPHRDQTDAAAAVALISELVPLEQQRVLDLACGPGRHSDLLRRHAGSVIGLDLSLPLLRRARSDYTPPLTVARGDMRSLPFAASSFDVVVNLFTSFGYFDRDEEHSKVLQEVARTLTGGGLFVLDYLNASLLRDSLVAHEDVTIGGRRVTVDRRISDDGRYVLKEMHLLDIDRTFQERVRLLEPQDFDRILSEVGLSVWERFGSYAGDALTADSPRVLVFAVNS